MPTPDPARVARRHFTAATVQHKSEAVFILKASDPTFGHFSSGWLHMPFASGPHDVTPYIMCHLNVSVRVFKGQTLHYWKGKVALKWDASGNLLDPFIPGGWGSWKPMEALFNRMLRTADGNRLIKKLKSEVAVDFSTYDPNAVRLALSVL